MAAGAVMIQGTGSNVGKSMIVAGLCRAARRRGINVAPFKPQNMSNNAAVTVDGGEVGRAQALQARAAGLALHSDMNPVLLKPESDTGSQLIVQGQRFNFAEAQSYQGMKTTLLSYVLESFERLKAQHDLIIVEGAGSPAEVNLRNGDIANMGFALAAGVPVVLCGDIDRGGVIAQIVGTQNVMSDEDCGAVKGFIINKFRGDPALFDDGYAAISEHTGWPGLGVAPWFSDAWKLPAEDAQEIVSQSGDGAVHIVCLGLSRIANFDDLDPLSQEPGVRLTFLEPGRPIPADADAVILPGTKSTRADLAFLRDQGWDVDLVAHYRRGGRVLGICGGYQMLGQMISDPDGLDGRPGETPGLGLLNLATVMERNKTLTEVAAVHAASGVGFSGYEIHMGATEGEDRQRPFAHVEGRHEGAISADGLVEGSYLHGMFSDDAFRQMWLAGLGVPSSTLAYDVSVDTTLDRLADHLEAHLDVSGIFDLAR